MEKEAENKNENEVSKTETGASGSINEIVPAVVSDPAPKQNARPKKAKGTAGKIVCVAICCTLAGGALGAGGVIAYERFFGRNHTKMERPSDLDRSELDIAPGGQYGGDQSGNTSKDTQNQDMPGQGMDGQKGRGDQGKGMRGGPEQEGGSQGKMQGQSGLPNQERNADPGQGPNNQSGQDQNTAPNQGQNGNDYPSQDNSYPNPGNNSNGFPGQGNPSRGNGN